MIESETVDILISYVKDPFSSGAEAKQKAGKKNSKQKNSRPLRIAFDRALTRSPPEGARKRRKKRRRRRRECWRTRMMMIKKKNSLPSVVLF